MVMKIKDKNQQSTSALLTKQMKGRKQINDDTDK